MKYLIYTRVSERGSDWQGETSCEAQAAECRRHVLQSDKAAAFSELREEFVSGTSLKKRLLSRVLDDAKNGTAAWDVLVSLDLDRLFRSTEECLSSFRVLSEAGKGVVLVRQNIDLSGPYGRFTLTVLAAVSQLVAQIGAQKTLDKMEHIARSGEWPCGVVPMGYMRAGKRNNVLAVNEAKAPMVRAMFAAALDGVGPTELARLHRLPVNTVIKTLANPMYCGILRYGKIEAQGKHPPLVSPDDYRRLQAMHSKITASRTTRQQYAYLLTGRVKCACGGSMSPGGARGRTKWYPYYKCKQAGCTSDRRLERADWLDAEVLKAVAETAYSPEATARMAQDARLRGKLDDESRGPAMTALRDKVAVLKSKIDRLAALLTESADMPSAHKRLLMDLDTAQREHDAEAGKLVALESATPNKDTQTVAGMRKAWRGVADRMASAKGSDTERRQWALGHVESVVYKDGGWVVTIYSMAAGPVCLTRPDGTPQGSEANHKTVLGEVRISGRNHAAQSCGMAVYPVLDGPRWRGAARASGFANHQTNPPKDRTAR